MALCSRGNDYRANSGIRQGMSVECPSYCRNLNGGLYTDVGYVCASSRHVLPWDTICMASVTQTGMTHGALGFWGVLFDVNNSSLSSVSIVHRFCALSWRWMARVGGSGFALQHSLAWFCMLTCVSDACNHFENRAPMLESTARHGAKRPQLRLGTLIWATYAQVRDTSCSGIPFAWLLPHKLA